MGGASLPRDSGRSEPTGSLGGPQEPHSLPCLVRIFFNLILVAVIALLIDLKLNRTGCVPLAVEAVCWAVLAVAIGHLTWRYLGRVLGRLELNAGIFGFMVGQLGSFFDVLHPRGLSNRTLWTGAALLGAAALFFQSSLSPLRRAELLPVVQGFRVSANSGSVRRLGAGDRIEISRGEGVLVQAIVEPESSQCSWSAEEGGIQASAGCSVSYTAPMEAVHDTLSVLVKSPCGTYSTSASLHTEVTHDRP